MKSCVCVKKLFSCPVAVSSGIILASVIALASAYTAQFGFGLEPCVLCLWQRIPYAAAILLGIFGLIARNNNKLVAVFVLLSALALLIGAGIAGYHVGVEERWWVSGVEGCAVSFEEEGASAASLLDKIMQAPTVSCTEIAWRDPVLGISMAGYNAALSLFLAISCAIAAAAIKRRPSAG